MTKPPVQWVIGAALVVLLLLIASVSIGFYAPLSMTTYFNHAKARLMGQHPPAATNVATAVAAASAPVLAPASASASTPTSTSAPAATSASITSSAPASAATATAPSASAAPASHDIAGDAPAADLTAAASPARVTPKAAFHPPAEGALPKGEFGAIIKTGERIFTETPQAAARFVGNSMRCSSCHLDAGRLADSAPLWGAFVSYPAYRSKTKSVNTFAERLQGCFQYSMNGTAPPLGDPVLVALESYAYWLASGAPVDPDIAGRGYPALPAPAQPADFARGQKVFEQQCALCHGANGAGQRSADGYTVFPALWGDDSFNWGAGMGRVNNAAAFIKANMPLGLGGSLTAQQAWDVALFMNSHERPQDPRYTGSVDETRSRFHDTSQSMYGKTVAGQRLGDTGPPKPRRVASRS